MLSACPSPDRPQHSHDAVGHVGAALFADLGVPLAADLPRDFDQWPVEPVAHMAVNLEFVIAECGLRPLLRLHRILGQLPRLPQRHAARRLIALAGNRVGAADHLANELPSILPSFL